MNINELLDYLDYDNLIKYLRKRYKEVREGEFIVFEDKELEIYNILVVRKGQNYKEDVSRLKKEIENDAGVVEGERREYGILFVGNQVVFLRRVIKGLESKVAVLRKSIDKITPAFKKKLRKLLKDVGNWQHWEELFDRSDIIEEFYKLYIKARENLLNNIKGIHDDNKKEEFADNLLMQLLIIWYLQKRGFLNNDPNYLVNKFREYKRLGFKSYYDFLRSLFTVMMDEPNDGIYYRDDRFDRIVVTGPAPFLNGPLEEVEIPDKVFYIEGKTDLLKKVNPKKIKSFDVPILNLFESRDWTEGNIDEYVLGAIFEKLMTAEERKEKGAYYTPEPITKYICDNTIKPYLTDRINEEFGTKYKSLDEFFEEDTVEEHYKFLFNELQNIKILDPASGSGHFLETAINVLVEIYEKIRERARKLGFSLGNFVITTANEKGEIISEPLLAIEDEDERKLKLKFHIIISRNIYGVDILPSAIKVARARLFLSLAKHFDAEKGVYVRFPNVHFNLRVGNSLIGFADTKIFEKGRRQVTLEEFFTNKYGEPLKIKLSKKLEDYIKKMDNVIGTNAYPLLVEVHKEFNKKLTGKILEKVLRLRSDLIKILLVSLNTDYAVELKRLIDEITDRFNEKLNEEFVKHLRRHGIKIDVNDLKEKIGYFHWIMEFSEVFLEKGGFDVVVGNPPYGNILSDDEKEISRVYSSYTREIASVFVERVMPLNKDKGYLSFIITYAITFSKDLWGTREKIYKNYRECFISTFDRDKCRFFDNMTQSVSIMLCKKKTPGSNCKFYTSRMFREMPELEKIEFQYANDYLLGNKIGVSFTDKHRLPKIGDEITLHILEKLIENKYSLNDLILEDSNERIWIRTSGNYWYNAWDRMPYQSTEIKAIKVDPIFKDFLLILINSSTYYLWFRIYGDGRHMNTDIMKAFPIPQKEKILPLTKFFSFLSSLLMDFLFYNFDEEHNRFETSNVKPVIDLCDIVIGKLYGLTKEEIDYILNYEDIIRGGKKIQDLFYTLVEYALLSLYKGRNTLDYSIIKFLIYELYFKEKFHEDGLYPQAKEYLLELVSRHLKPINYDRWSELYWKKQLEGNLSEDEEKELKELEEQNLNTIKEVYEELLNDEQIQELISKIKSHEWVKTIEGQFN